MFCWPTFKSVVVGVSLVAWMGLFFAPAAALGQSASGIAGVVRDSSGGVLPGVTVEAASPVLIEKVRTVVTDGEGRYNITGLQIGTYAVTFSLAGFNSFRREGIILTAGFTATVNAEMQIGSVAETITVTGSSPLVDTQNTRAQTVISTNLIEVLPTARELNAMVALVPGLVSTADVGGSQGAHEGSRVSRQFHGITGNPKSLFDGMRINVMVGIGNHGYLINTMAVEEMSLETSGFLPESSSSGVQSNAIPKDGGNSFRFGGAGLYTNNNLQSDNLTDDLRTRGLTTVDTVLKLYDGGGYLGGPIKQNSVWFFTAHRWWGSRNGRAGIFFNKTQGTPVYTPDPDRPSYRWEETRSNLVRLTWQASSRNKISAFIDNQKSCTCSRVEVAAPEAITQWRFSPQGLYQGTWSAPLTNRLLLDGGGAAVISHWPNYRQPGVTTDTISTTERSTGFRYNAAATYNKPQNSDRYVQRFALSYVTGSHAFKTGFQVDQGVSDVTTPLEKPGGDIAYTFLNGRPNQITQYATPYTLKNRMKADLGVYAQDQWTLKRLTLSGGVRFEYFNSYVAAQRAPAGPFVPERDFAAVRGVPIWKDLNPRVGAAWDLFGNGRTALKAYAGRTVGVHSIDIAGANNPLVTSVNNANRPWNDLDRDFVPDCDLTNSALNGECGAISNVNFGKVNPNANRWDPELLRGWDKRDYVWSFLLEVQQQLGSSASLTAGYYPNKFGNFRVDDNLAVTPADYDTYCVTAPTDPRLPGGGGYQVCGLADVSRAKFGQVNTLTTEASNFGEWKRRSDFFTVGIDTRLGSGIRLGASTDFGRIVEDRCFVFDSPQSLLYCHNVSPFAANTQFKLNGSYPLPMGMAVAAVYQDLSGPSIAANYAVPNSVIAPSLGRNLAACGSSATCTQAATVPLVAPNEIRDDRRRQLDLRFSKAFTLPRGRFQANLDIFNAFNASSVLTLNENFGAAWRKPNTILDGRLIEISGNVSF